MTPKDRPHSRCKTCGIYLPTRDDATAHLRETSAGSPTRHSHTVTVINPTDEERRQSRARNLVRDEVADAIERIANGAGDLTGKEIREALSWIDLDEEWTDWCEEMDR